jgi:hypothetical protein
MRSFHHNVLWNVEYKIKRKLQEYKIEIECKIFCILEYKIITTIHYCEYKIIILEYKNNRFYFHN